MKCELTDYKDICIICGRPREETHHLIMGISNRRLADEDNLVAPLCNECHTLVHRNSKLFCMSRIIGQLLWEREYVCKDDELFNEAREMFRKRYGKSYL